MIQRVNELFATTSRLLEVRDAWRLDAGLSRFEASSEQLMAADAEARAATQRRPRLRPQRGGVMFTSDASRGGSNSNSQSTNSPANARGGAFGSLPAVPTSLVTSTRN